MSHGIFLFIAVTFLASSDVHGYAILRYEQSGPEKCCVPRQYSVMMIDMKTISSGQITLLAMQMDFDQKKMVMLNNTEPMYKILIDYQKEMLYSVAVKDPVKCYKVPFPMPLVQCVPDDAEYLGSSYLGPMGAGQLPYDAWRMKLNGFSATLAVTKANGTCVPIAEGVSSPEGDQLYFYSAFQPRLTDPDAFKLPAVCDD